MPAGYFHFKVVYNATYNENDENGIPIIISDCTLGERHVGGFVNIKYRKITNQYSDEYKNYLLGGGA